MFSKFKDPLEGVQRHFSRDPQGGIMPPGGSENPGAAARASKLVFLLKADGFFSKTAQRGGKAWSESLIKGCGPYTI